MRIKKTSYTTPVQAEIVDSYSTSTTNGYSANYVNNAVEDTYSTSEVKTNKVWIDGKPIYRKIVSTGAISTTGNDNFISLGINSSTISQITKIGGIINIIVGTIPVNFHNKYDQQFSIFTYVNLEQTTARVDVKNGVAITGGYIVVEYTKAS